MKRKWFYHPVFVFVFSILALCASLSLSIYWYMSVSSRLDDIIRRFNLAPGGVLRVETWVVVLVLSLLVGIILMGIFTIFVYSQKTLHLYRLQNNFISNFTHELKTPVTSLRLYIETFFRHELPREQQKRYLDFMLSDVERLSKNISQILDLARVESRRYGGEFTRADLVVLVTSFHEENKHLFARADIRVHPPASGDYVVSVNLPLFEMLLMNIITNAIKYKSRETSRLDISFSRTSRRIRIRFEDNGIGLDKKDRRRIFRKFYQVGRSEDMTAKGSGLGLYLVQNIARLHRGRVTADSPGPGQGSVFTLSLSVLPAADGRKPK